MWIAAHPDDEAVVAPLLAKWCVEDEADCALMVLTRGESGPCLLSSGCLPDVASVRSSEAGAASQLFRAGSILLTYPDGGGVAKPVWSDTAAETIARYIEAFRPELILTFDPRHGTTCHPDHRETGKLVLEAVERLSYEPKVYLLETVVSVSTDPLTISFLPALASAERFDATRSWQAIFDDMRRHPSQFDAQWIFAVARVLPQDRAVFIAPAERVMLQDVASCP